MEASAPGKLIVTGEYAVLEGSPAVVIAVDRRANVRLSSAPEKWTLQAPELGIADAPFRISREGCVWEQAGERKTAVVDGVFTALAQRGLISDETPPASVTTSTAALWDAGSGKKLGFGSSAAITSALVRALLAHADCGSFTWDTFDPSLFALLRTAHEQGQGKAGSGADIAACLLGGALIYSNHDDNPDARIINLPDDLYWLAVWSGSSTSTAARLQTLSQFSKTEPAVYEKHMTQLGQRAEASALACSEGCIDDMLEEFTRYRDQVAGFGNAVGIDILSRPHRELAALGDACQVVYKSSGAGGGDLGLAFSACPAALTEFGARAANAGFQPLPDLKLDLRGTALTAD